MIENGLEREVKNLLSMGYSKDLVSMQGIGYKEVVEGLALGQSVEEIKNIIKQNTRNYAKRQITFFKRMKNHILLDPSSNMTETVAQLL